MKAGLLAFLAGLAAACGFEPLGLWPLTLGGVALLIHLLARARRLRSVFALGWWFGVGNFTLGLNWIATAFTFQSNMPASLGWAAVVLLSFYLAAYTALGTGAAWWGVNKLPLPLAGEGEGEGRPLEIAHQPGWCLMAAYPHPRPLPQPGEGACSTPTTLRPSPARNSPRDKSYTASPRASRAKRAC